MDILLKISLSLSLAFFLLLIYFLVKYTADREFSNKNSSKARHILIIEKRKNTVIFDYTGQFSLSHSKSNKLVIIIHNTDGTDIKHHFNLNSKITYKINAL